MHDPIRGLVGRVAHGRHDIPVEWPQQLYLYATKPNGFGRRKLCAARDQSRQQLYLDGNGGRLAKQHRSRCERDRWGDHLRQCFCDVNWRFGHYRGDLCLEWPQQLYDDPAKSDGIRSGHLYFGGDKPRQRLHFLCHGHRLAKRRPAGCQRQRRHADLRQHFHQFDGRIQHHWGCLCMERAKRLHVLATKPERFLAGRL